MKTFNKVDPNNLYWNEHDKEYQYKDMRYYTKNYLFFGAWYCLIKEIFSNSVERKFFSEYAKRNKE